MPYFCWVSLLFGETALYKERSMAASERDCSYEGQRVQNGAEVCSAELGFGDCMKCEKGELQYRPHFYTDNYPERL